MSSDDSCTSSAIQNFLQAGFATKCAYVQANCADQTSTIDFFSFYYCDLNEKLYFFIPLAILIILFLFYAISSTAEDYLEPVLSRISVIFNFSESLAGVTLVALANGAPDVVSAYAAGANADLGVLVPLGSLFGAGMFTTCIVFCVCIYASPGKEIQTDKDVLTRDCLFYLIGAIYFLVFGLIGKIYAWSTVGIFAIYLAFLAVALYYEYRFRQAQQKQHKILLEPLSTTSYACVKHDDQFTVRKYISEVEAQVDALQAGDYDKIFNAQDYGELISPLALDRYASHSGYSKIQFEFKTLKRKMRHEMKEMIHRNVFWKVFAFSSFPLKLARSLTIPKSHEEDWNKTLAVIQPFTVSAFLIWQFGYIEDVFLSYTGLAIWIISCACVSLMLWRFTLAKTVPDKAIGMILLSMAFISAATWINLLANIIVDFITLLSVFTGLPLNYIGLTLLAWGNSLPDLFVDTTLAKKGLGQAAVSGVFAGQYFNLAVGFGLSLIRQVIKFGTRDFDLKVGDNITRVSLLLIVCLIVNLVVTMIYGHKQNYLLKKGFAVYLLGFYVLFFAAVTGLSLL